MKAVSSKVPQAYARGVFEFGEASEFINAMANDEPFAPKYNELEQQLANLMTGQISFQAFENWFEECAADFFYNQSEQQKRDAWENRA